MAGKHPDVIGGCLIETVGVVRVPADSDEHGFKGLCEGYLLAVALFVEADGQQPAEPGSGGTPEYRFGGVCATAQVTVRIDHGKFSLLRRFKLGEERRDPLDRVATWPGTEPVELQGGMVEGLQQSRRRVRQVGVEQQSHHPQAFNQSVQNLVKPGCVIG
jgi:hypothetical protein